MNQQSRRLSLAFTLLLSLVLILVAVAAHLPAQAAGNNLTLATVTAAAGTSGSFAITLDNNDAVASGQLRFTYAASLGLTITGVQVTDRTAGFTSTGSSYNTGNASLAGYQVLFYNLNSLTIAPGTGAILTISYTTAANASGNTDLRFTQAILANTAAQALPVTPVDGSLTLQAETVTPTATSTATTTPTPTIADIVTPTVTNTPMATATSGETLATATPTPTLTATAEAEGTPNTPTPVTSLPAQIYLPLIQR